MLWVVFTFGEITMWWSSFRWSDFVM